jgi:DNA polymerase III delta prime subunit
MGIIGNSLIRQEMETQINSCESGVYFVHGPFGLGKKTFLKEFLPETSLFVESNIDGIRDSKNFLRTRSSYQNINDVVIYDCDGMSIPAQDACLKLIEEPPQYSRIWLHSTDIYGLGSAILSRKRKSFHWTTLNNNEMTDYASSFGELDSLYLDISGGRPGIYEKLILDPRYKSFHNDLLDMLNGSKNLLMCQTPMLITEIDEKSFVKEPLYMLIQKLSKRFPSQCSGLLKYASKILSKSSLNHELHWFSAISEI